MSKRRLATAFSVVLMAAAITARAATTVAIGTVNNIVLQPGRLILGQAVSDLGHDSGPLLKIFGWLSPRQLVRGLTFGTVK